MTVALAAGSLPCPRVDITVTLANTAPVKVTVWRQAAGGPQVILRGAKSILATATGAVLAFTDYEAPFGVESRYLVRSYSLTGALMSAEQQAITLNVNEAWISDPLAPAVSTRVRFADDSLSAFTYPSDRSLLPISGSALPVATSGGRRAASAVPLSMMAHDKAAADALRATFATADVFLLRLPASWLIPLPGSAYLSADQVQESVVATRSTQGVAASYWQFDTTVDLVAMPAASIVVPPRTYGTVLSEAISYDANMTLRPTYLDMLRGSA